MWQRLNWCSCFLSEAAVCASHIISIILFLCLQADGNYKVVLMNRRMEMKLLPKEIWAVRFPINQAEVSQSSPAAPPVTWFLLPVCVWSRGVGGWWMSPSHRPVPPPPTPPPPTHHPYTPTFPRAVPSSVCPPPPSFGPAPSLWPSLFLFLSVRSFSSVTGKNRAS